MDNVWQLEGKVGVCSNKMIDLITYNLLSATMRDNSNNLRKLY